VNGNAARVPAVLVDVGGFCAIQAVSIIRSRSDRALIFTVESAQVKLKLLFSVAD